MIARDIMDTRFHTLRSGDVIASAVRRFQTASRTEHKNIFGLMVTDEKEHLVGMLSMHDILQFIQPKHIHIWGEMEDLDPSGLLDDLLGRVKNIQVGDIMTREVVTVTPDTHLLVIVDTMIKKHVRRIPVTEAGEVVGIVYRSAVFYHLLQKVLS